MLIIMAIKDNEQRMTSNSFEALAEQTAIHQIASRPKRREAPKAQLPADPRLVRYGRYIGISPDGAKQIIQTEIDRTMRTIRSKG